jgi:hypothetical protein
MKPITFQETINLLRQADICLFDGFNAYLTPVIPIVKKKSFVLSFIHEDDGKPIALTFDADSKYSIHKNIIHFTLDDDYEYSLTLLKDMTI